MICWRDSQVTKSQSCKIVVETGSTKHTKRRKRRGRISWEFHPWLEDTFVHIQFLYQTLQLLSVTVNTTPKFPLLEIVKNTRSCGVGRQLQCRIGNCKWKVSQLPELLDLPLDRHLVERKISTTLQNTRTGRSPIIYYKEANNGSVFRWHIMKWRWKCTKRAHANPILDLAHLQQYRVWCKGCFRSIKNWWIILESLQELPPTTVGEL